MAEHAGYKLCHWCGGWYHPTDFTRDRSRPDGLDVHCRVCRRDLRQLYRRDGTERPRRTPETRRAFTHPAALDLAWRYHGGESYSAMAREHGVDSETVRRACNRARLDERRFRLFRIGAWAWLRLRDEDSPAVVHHQPVSNRRVGETDRDLPPEPTPRQGELLL